MTSTVNASTTSGVIVTSDTSGSLALQTANTTALTISSGQVITASGSIGIGGTTPSSGIGIAFPATQSASSNANTLDDYEEGSWAYNFTATSGTITKSTTFANGQYIKIGRQVTVTGFLQAPSVSSPSGVLTVTGLPFVVTSVDNRSGFCGGGIFGNLLSSASVSPLMINSGSGLSSFEISKFVTGSSAGLAGDVIADTRFYLSFTYFTD
jgi:hypothetical protein